MRVLLDNTSLSNFALLGQADLLQQAFGTLAATTTQVMVEFSNGVAKGKLPKTNWDWLLVLTVSPHEKRLYQQFLRQVSAGEASCLAIAKSRNYRVVTDDQKARTLGSQMNLSITGTVGVLILLVRDNHLTPTQANELLSQMIAKGYRSPVEKLDAFL